MDRPPQIVLQLKSRTELERLLADGNTAQKIAKRARIVLISADGHGVMAIMREVGVSKTTVWRWQKYFVEAGVWPRSFLSSSRAVPMRPEIFRASWLGSHTHASRISVRPILKIVVLARRATMTR